MKEKFVWFLSVALVFLVSISLHAKQDMAKAVILDAKGNEVGQALLKSRSDGTVRMDLKVTGLPAGTHAAHIHEVGKCEAPDFKSAGGHFNPGSKHHGHKNPQGWHAGDLPNIVVGKNGKGTLSWGTQDVTLAADAENSVFRSGGTSIVIHALPDDEMTDPAGNAGGRIACGVIAH